MQLALLFLIPERLDHKLMFTCPTCQGQTFLSTTNELDHLRCSHCGDVHDAQNAQLEVLSPSKPTPTRAGRHLRDLA